MTYSLHTLSPNRQAPPPARSGWARFADEFGLVVGLLLLGFWLLALMS